MIEQWQIDAIEFVDEVSRVGPTVQMIAESKFPVIRQ